MELPDFSIDTTSSGVTPDIVKRRRALADQLVQQGSQTTPVYGWTGVLARALQGGLGGLQRAQADQAEQQGQSGYQQRLAQALQGGNGQISPQAMISLAGDPWANPAQTQAITHVADMQHQQAREAVADAHQKLMEGLAIRAANRADDDTPDNFHANPDFGKVPDAPQYLPNTGTPADPAYIKKMTEAKGGAYDPDVISWLADRNENGDATWKVGLARSPGLIAQVESEVARRAKAKKEADPTANPAVDILQARANQAGRSQEQRTLGAASASNQLYGNAASATMQTAIEKSNAVPRGKFVPINRLMQMAETQISDPAVAELRTATNTLVSDYAKAITPVGAPTDSAREHARELLDMASSPEAYERVVRLMHREIQNTHSAIDFTKKQLQSGKGGEIPALSPAAAPAGAADPLGIR